MKFFSRHPVVPVLRFSGAIGGVSPLRSGINLATSAASIERAFSMSNAKAVAVQINSPGGSPVQSMLIFKRIRDLAEEKKLPVYTFAEDVAASGGYMLLLAGDEIYADISSIVGSIGVISAGFGFDKLISNYGVERRVYTSGKSKMSLDPFQPEKEEDVKRLKLIQEDVHKHFIDLVKTRRGAKLEEADDSLFSGEFWSGIKAHELGLIDGIADLRSKMREKYGDKVKLKLVTQEQSFLRRRFRGLPGLGAMFGSSGAFESTSFAEDLISAIEARSIWARYGL